MKLISRTEALTQDLKGYFTGKPCKHGHIAERRVINSECMACRRERKAAQVALDPAAHRAQVRRADHGLETDDDPLTLRVYKITNAVDGRYCYGSSVLTLRKCWQLHKTRANGRPDRPLYAAMNEIGHAPWSLVEIASFTIHTPADEAFGRSYEASLIAACFDDVLCMNKHREPGPLPINSQGLYKASPTVYL